MEKERRGLTDGKHRRTSYVDHTITIHLRPLGTQDNYIFQDPESYNTTVYPWGRTLLVPFCLC